MDDKLKALEEQFEKELGRDALEELRSKIDNAEEVCNKVVERASSFIGEEHPNTMDDVLIFSLASLKNALRAYTFSIMLGINADESIYILMGASTAAIYANGFLDGQAHEKLNNELKGIM